MRNQNRRTLKNVYKTEYRSADKAPAGKKNSRGNSRKPPEPEKKSRPARVAVPKITFRASWLWAFFRFLLCAAILCALFSGIAFGIIKAYQFCTTSNYFNITSITVDGNSRVSTDEILSTCHLKKGINSLSVKIHELEKLLLKNPWLENVTIKRELPGTIAISVRERKPVFCAKKNDILYYINSQGKIIAPVESSNFLSLPILEIGPGGEESLHIMAEFIEQFKFAGFPFDLSQISWFKISAGGGFELYWEGRHLKLSIGLEDWKDNIKRIASVVTDIEKRKETEKVTGIRAADGQVWMTKESD